MWVSNVSMALFLLCFLLLLVTGNWWYFGLALAYQVVMVFNAAIVSQGGLAFNEKGR